MLGLIETHFTSAGKPDLGDRTPPGLLGLRTPDALRTERQFLSLQIVTHEIELVPLTLLGRRDRTSAGGSAKISHPWPASTEASPRISRKKARSAAASLLYTITWAPKIIRCSFRYEQPHFKPLPSIHQE